MCHPMTQLQLKPKKMWYTDKLREQAIKQYEWLHEERKRAKIDKIKLRRKRLIRFRVKATTVLVLSCLFILLLATTGNAYGIINEWGVISSIFISCMVFAIGIMEIFKK